MCIINVHHLSVCRGCVIQNPFAGQHTSSSRVTTAERYHNTRIQLEPCYQATFSAALNDHTAPTMFSCGKPARFALRRGMTLTCACPAEQRPHKLPRHAILIEDGSDPYGFHVDLESRGTATERSAGQQVFRHAWALDRARYGMPCSDVDFGDELFLGGNRPRVVDTFPQYLTDVITGVQGGDAVATRVGGGLGKVVRRPAVAVAAVAAAAAAAAAPFYFVTPGRGGSAPVSPEMSPQLLVPTVVVTPPSPVEFDGGYFPVGV